MDAKREAAPREFQTVVSNDRVEHGLTRAMDEANALEGIPKHKDFVGRDQAAFARKAMSGFSGRSVELAQLDAFLQGEEVVLALIGAPGSGKSALLARWTAELVARQETGGGGGLIVVAHYLSAGGTAENEAATLRRLLFELDQRLGLGLGEPPLRLDQVRRAFDAALRRTNETAQHGVLIVIDAIDQLTAKEALASLVEAPLSRVRFVLSMTSEAFHEQLCRRGAGTLRLGEMSEPERRRLVRELLRHGEMELSAIDLQRIVAARSAGIPRYLRAFVEELRFCETQELLAPSITWYLRAQSCAALYGLVLQRWEASFLYELPLLADALCLLGCTRRGLSDTELRRLVSRAGSLAPRGLLSSFIEESASASALVHRSGLIRLANPEVRAAVFERYRVAPERERELHQRLIEHFAFRASASRRAEELLWHLEALEALERNSLSRSSS